jgi:DNA-directed RNA polymerase specialized sigma24 family protein
MNRAAVGLGSWLETRGAHAAGVSLDAQESILNLHSFALWQTSPDTAQSARQQALHALVRELFAQLEPQEQSVLRGVHLEGRSARALARSLGLHHSAVGRLRAKAEEKLRGGLAAVLRYRALETAFGEDTDDGFYSHSA